MKLATALLRLAVAPSTNREYDRHWKVWTNHRGSSDPFLADLSIEQVRIEILTFFHDHIIRHGATPASVKAIWASMQHHLYMDLATATCISQDPIIKRGLAGARALATSLNPVNRRPVLTPVCEEMFTTSRLLYWTSGNRNEKMSDLGFRLAGRLGSRCSEVTIRPSTTHTLIARNVMFINKVGDRVASTEAARMGLHGDDVSSVEMTWPTTKTGSKTMYLSSVISEENVIIQDMLAWCLESQVTGGEPFLSYHHDKYHKSLTRHMLDEHTKAIAVAVRLDPNTFSTHSLRAGRATSLRAKGLSKEEIDSTLHWAKGSKSSRRYMRETPQTQLGTLSTIDLRILQSKAPVISGGVSPVGGGPPQAPQHAEHRVQVDHLSM